MRIVIGKALPIFEYRPASILPWRADTIGDAWSTDALTMRGASVRGYSHRFEGAPRQDDFAAAALDTSEVIVAVADGLSSASHSHIGSTIACRYALDFLARELDTGTSIRWHELIRGAAWALVEYAQRHFKDDATPDIAEELLATTLVAAVMVPDAHGNVTVSAVRVGDSAAWVLHGGSFRTLFATVSEYTGDGPVHTATAALPRVPDEIEPTTIQIGPGDTFLVGTDGFGLPLGDGDGEVGSVFARLLAQPPDLLDFIRHLDFSRETYDDDRTLVGFWAGSALGHEANHVSAHD
jgi:serine/threonine protein phosphatase PrpC